MSNTNLLGSIGGREVEADPPVSMGAVMIEPEVVDGLGTFPVDAPPTQEQRERAEAELARAVASADRRRILERLDFIKNQPLRPVALADVAQIRPDPAMTLSGAGTVLEDAGGAVRPGDAGVLRFTLPEQLSADPLENEAARRTALEGVVTLDACRPLVWSLLKAKKALPDRVPLAGGGVG